MTARVRSLAAQLLVIAKAPVPGRVKTRLTPPFSHQQAAELAEAALTDTLAAVAQVPTARRVIALDGTPGRWLPAGFDVIRQRGTGLDQRIAAAFSDAYTRLPLPVVLIGMDTPQVTPELLESAIRPLLAGDTPFASDATFGMASDGGFWLLGLRRPDPRLITGVRMSQSHTGAEQLARLAAAGLRVRQMPCCTDVDSAADAVAVARQIPHSRFAAKLRPMLANLTCPPRTSGLTTLLPASSTPV
jgi:rSAM/selenodomain-associated transferase 1